MLIALYVCVGFMLAILYIDLMFDVTAMPYRRTGTPLPKAVLDPITSYYGRITQNPYLLMFIMLVTTLCVVSEIVYGLGPAWAAYASLALIGLSAVASVAKVIPAAERLASGRETEGRQAELIHSMLPYHLLLLVNIVALAAIQFGTVGSGTPAL